MRLLYFGNNWLGGKVLEHLRSQGDTIAGLVIHPEGKRKLSDRIVAAADLPPERIFDGSRLDDPDTLARIRGLECDTGLSVLFDYILRPALLERLKNGVINLHPSYLPYNRGQYPNVWSIVDRTPAGVTLHYIDAGIDTGDIIAQRRVTVDPHDTGESLYHKLEQAALDLFRETWPAIRDGRISRTPQTGNGTAHRVRDVEDIDAIDPDRTYVARELIDVLRARTFPPHRGAYVTVDGKRYYLRLSVIPEEEM